MKTEILILQAAEAIKMFKIDHAGVCYLTVKNGFVRGFTSAEVGKHSPQTLRIERFEMRHGLTPGRWSAIGRELFILYTKEQQCQTHQKP